MSSPTKVPANMTSGVIKTAEKASATGTSLTSQAGAVVQLNSSEKIPSQYLSTGVHLGGIAANNLLDDYEEGTWTPAISISGSDVVDQTNSTKDYRKIGDVVCVSGHIVLDGAIPIGDFTLTGLPFTIGGRGIMTLNSRDESASFVFASKLIPNQFSESTTQLSCNTEVALAAGDRINISGFYFTSTG